MTRKTQARMQSVIEAALRAPSKVPMRSIKAIGSAVGLGPRVLLDCGHIEHVYPSSKIGDQRRCHCCAAGRPTWTRGFRGK